MKDSPRWCVPPLGVAQRGLGVSRSHCGWPRQRWRKSTHRAEFIPKSKDRGICRFVFRRREVSRLARCSEDGVRPRARIAAWSELLLSAHGEAGMVQALVNAPDAVG